MAATSPIPSSVWIDRVKLRAQGAPIRTLVGDLELLCGTYDGILHRFYADDGFGNAIEVDRKLIKFEAFDGYM